MEKLVNAMNGKNTLLLTVIIVVLCAIGFQLNQINNSINTTSTNVISAVSDAKVGVEHISETLDNVIACPPNDPLGLETNCEVSTVNQTNPLGI